MTHNFQIACGSVTGRDHILAGRNNQDAYAVASNGEVIAAVVCDGCSGDWQNDGRHSEAGALLGAKLMSVAFFDYAKLWTQTRDEACQQSTAFFPYAERIRQDVIARLGALAEHMHPLSPRGPRIMDVVNNYFLFTVIVAIITPVRTWVYSIGDGVFAVNGELSPIGPFAGNMPPYLAYGGLVDSSISPELTVFTCCASFSTADVKSLMIGTDGVMDFHDSAKKNIPGRDELLGPVSQFWTEDKYMTNPDLMRRRLAIANKEHAIPDWQQRTMRREIGLLHDDTTMIVIRRT